MEKCLVDVGNLRMKFNTEDHLEALNLLSLKEQIRMFIGKDEISYNVFDLGEKDGDKHKVILLTRDQLSSSGYNYILLFVKVDESEESLKEVKEEKERNISLVVIKDVKTFSLNTDLESTIYNIIGWCQQTK